MRSRNVDLYPMLNKGECVKLPFIVICCGSMYFCLCNQQEIKMYCNIMILQINKECDSVLCTFKNRSIFRLICRAPIVQARNDD